MNTTTPVPVNITRAIAVQPSHVAPAGNVQDTVYCTSKSVMSPSRQLAARLLPFLGSRGYSSAARYAARAGEDVIAVNNAHKAASTVMEVSTPGLDLRRHLHSLLQLKASIAGHFIVHWDQPLVYATLLAVSWQPML